MKTRLFDTFCVLMWVSAAQGHHSFDAQYDASKRVTLEGVITAIEWTTPHTFYFLAVPDSTGKIKEWHVEGDAPHKMNEMGWSREMLFNMVKAKTKITLTGYLSRKTLPGDLFQEAYIERVALPDGRTLPFHRPRTP